MRITSLINEMFTNYKIEEWNNEKQEWEHLTGYFNKKIAKINYKYLIKNCKGIYRLIKVIEIDEVIE